MERTVLVTGAATPVGRASVERFAGEEWTVYAAATGGSADDLPDGVRQETLDVTDRRDVARVVERMTDETDRVDALVTFPGRRQLGPLEDVAPDAVGRQLDTTVGGYHRLVRAVLPEMRRRSDGAIVTVTSAAARAPFPGGGAYAGATAAVAAASRSLRHEVPDGIDVVQVEPGPIGRGEPTERTDEAAVAADGGERTAAYEGVYDLLDDWAMLGTDNPLAVSPEAVADTVLNAASATEPAARYPVGPVAQAAGFARFLPSWVVDAGWSIARRLG